MSKYNPNVGDRYIAKCEEFDGLIFNFEVIAIVSEKGEKYLVCHKVGGKVTFGECRGLVVFDQEGLEVDPIEPEYAYSLVKRSKAKPRWSAS